MSGHGVLDLVWLIPALPAAGAVVLLLFGKRIGEPRSGWIATSTMGLSFVGSIVAFAVLLGRDADQREQVRTLWTWFQSGNFVVKMGFLVDPLSVTMILFVTGVGTLIHLYSIGYMHGDPRYS
ncbi:MAG: NADH-quinone oxidoreductase subunit, partial [Actinomycetota bacterium]|nr:NADH-quinone oxidoreductase subunit [Actinomycetota bacterium]